VERASRIACDARISAGESRRPFFFAPSMPARDHFVHFLQRRQMMSEIVEIITALVRMFLPDRKE
jgi:hypothetical protein